MAEYLYNDKIMTEREIKALNPNVSYREPTQVGAVAILPTPKPTPTTSLKVVVRDGVTTDTKGNIVQAWTERDMFSDYQTPELDADGNEVLDANGDVVYITVTKLEQDNAYLAKLEAEALQQKINSATTAVDALIQAEIDLYNQANGVQFAGIDAIAKYVLVPTYAHYDFCKSMVDWVAVLWESARTSTATTEEEFLAGLPTRV